MRNRHEASRLRIRDPPEAGPLCAQPSKPASTNTTTAVHGARHAGDHPTGDPIRRWTGVLAHRVHHRVCAGQRRGQAQAECMRVVDCIPSVRVLHRNGSRALHLVHFMSRTGGQRGALSQEGDLRAAMNGTAHNERRHPRCVQAALFILLEWGNTLRIKLHHLWKREQQPAGVRAGSSHGEGRSSSTTTMQAPFVPLTVKETRTPAESLLVKEPRFNMSSTWYKRPR